MRFSELLSGLPGIRSAATHDPEIGGLATHSGRVKPGDLFVALKGDAKLPDRHPFIADAIRAKAAAIVADKEAETGSVPIAYADDTHRALAFLAKKFYNQPTDQLKLVAVTGTNGKTSTVYLIHAILEASGLKPGLIGTIEHNLGRKREVSQNSTPQAHDLHRLFREMVDAGCRTAVMEATSEGLAQQRLSGLDFQAAVFTNLTRDHLDYHGSFDAYLAAKASLFDNLRSESFAIINTDDSAAIRLLAHCSARVVRYGKSGTADVRIVGGQTSWRGTELQLMTPEGALAVSLALQGSFQFYNATAAVTTGLALGLSRDTIVEALRDVRVPGRFEGIDCGQDFGVIVDYAHAPDGLENVLSTARAFTQGKLISVFGCGGDRDRGKRPVMGEISARLADFTYVTSDNPRTEDPDAIIGDILPGVGDAPHKVIADRRKAIEMAIGKARSGDLVIIAGKGHENYQEVNHVKTHFDDREVAREILSTLRR
ncbi:MAG: UDP-N-acetylmuramoyl-L-alanyl-D-glutamate--2,6-diaminopimelate ligase [bacterium]|jgi:UDP-N-acetylmuramoyl-L-alanyl-D-glutamate--2,6-diaminopimelate ligase|nr:UDP-N-acetylmuramoyl-L-alanyl-D-glutamate--2,6-diaminopimelate ligase [bacterium]